MASGSGPWQKGERGPPTPAHIPSSYHGRPPLATALVELGVGELEARNFGGAWLGSQH
jgi:hypothetical protein